MATTTIKRFREAVDNRYETIKRRKGSQRVVGWMCSYMPEEVIHAAGLYPVRVLGGESAPSHADAYLHINMCSLVRSCLEEAFQGNYQFLDGFVTLNTCDNIRRLYDVWAYYIKTPFTHILSLPHKVNDDAIEYFRTELVRLQQHIEQHFGVAVSHEALRKSIATFNQTRRLLEALDEKRRATPPVITGADFLTAVLAGMVLPKEEFNPMLKDLLAELESRPSPASNGKARLLVVGSEMDDPKLMELIEDNGAVIVADDLCTSSKYYWDQVDPAGDPLAALARRYLSRPPCPRMRPSDQRLAHLKELVQTRKVDGVIIEIMKFCKLHDEGSLAVREALTKWGVPHLTISREYNLTGAGATATRVQAFLEQINGI
ncbi:MAG: 2-hydroxyacyl-CoA dehydratase [Chloroflexi bacterium]|nr:2-hydroxyacyl-CoA dehydratase [Chloroflexota bacterium]